MRRSERLFGELQVPAGVVERGRRVLFTGRPSPTSAGGDEPWLEMLEHDVAAGLVRCERRA
ncbi:hypothetical protein [Streptomyces olivaceiscleroticus]|uniref:Uncharacterized protein n=1 Tax=Streptomyces olivaceiscleroticus TaxID=68245 RepID=A0ABN0ZNR8_9ACTN